MGISMKGDLYTYIQIRVWFRQSVNSGAKRDKAAAAAAARGSFFLFFFLAWPINLGRYDDEMFISFVAN